MRLCLGLILAAVIAASAVAQVAKNPETPSLLFWTPEQQRQGYRAMETMYEVATVPRGDYVRPLPVAQRQIDPAVTVAGRAMSVDEFMQAYRASGVIVLKDGEILLERYGFGRGPNERWTSFSVAKSVTSTLVGAAIRDGKIRSISSPVTDYLPELKGSGYEGVTVGQLLTMSSGVRWNEDYGDPNSDVARSGAEPVAPGVNPIVAYMRKLPRAHPPGTKFNYNTGETDLVGVLVSRATGKSLSQYASEKIWRPFGMEQDAIWLVDRAGHERGGCCMSMTLRDYARIGLFMLEGGVARGERILPPGWVAEATTKRIDNGLGGYGYFWWMRNEGGYAAEGIFGQSVVVIPEDRLVVAINSAWPEADAPRLWMAQTQFIEGLRAAAR